MFFHPTLIKSQEHNWHWTAKTEIFPQENDTWMTGGPEFLWILLKCSFWETFICILGCTIFSECSQIKPTFLHSMCIGEIRSHAKFQVSSFKDLSWPPLFVNQSWHQESHLKWPESGTFDLAPFIGIKNALQNGITLGVLAYRKYLKRLEENW